MTLPRLSALNQYWLKWPPVHVLVAGAVGYEPPPAEVEAPAASEREREATVEEFIAFFQSVGGTVNNG